MKYLKLFESSDDFEDICYSIENMFITHIADKYDISSKNYSFYRHRSEKDASHYDHRRNYVVLNVKIEFDKILQESDVSISELLRKGCEFENAPIKDELKEDIMSFIKRVESHYQSIESDSEFFSKKALTTYMNSFQRDMTTDDFNKWLPTLFAIQSKIPKKNEKMQSEIRIDFANKRVPIVRPGELGHEYAIICEIDIKFYWK